MYDFTTFLENSNTDVVSGGLASDKSLDDIISMWIDNLSDGAIPTYIIEYAINKLDRDDISPDTLESWVADIIRDNLEIGVAIEAEHSDNIDVQTDIAKDHLVESPVYYYELDILENRADVLVESENPDDEDMDDGADTNEVDIGTFLMFLMQ